MFYKIDVLESFVEFTGKQLCLSLFLNKVVDRRPTTVIKKRLWHRCFPVIFLKYLRTRFLKYTVRRMLLSKLSILLQQETLAISVDGSGIQGTKLQILSQTSNYQHCTKNEVFIKDFLCKSDQISGKLLIWSNLLKKSLMKTSNFVQHYSSRFQGNRKL